MAFSSDTYTSAGATQYDLTFNYLDQDHVSVFVDGVEDTTFTWVNASRIQLSATPSVGATVLITRTTPKTEDLLEVDWTNGSAITESNLDTSDLQLLYIAQEAFDATDSLISLDTDNKWDAGNKILKNLAEPTSANDAVRLTDISSYLTNAQAAQTAAETAETNAETSASAASTSATNAANSATNAATSATNASSSATAAASSASSASTSATNAASSATTATTKASEASTSATNAATSETNAAASASAASTSATNASTSATSASSSASAASTSATNAASSASAAATSATNASAAQTAAETAQAAAEASAGLLDAKGQLLTHNGTENVKLAVGTNDQVLIADSTVAAGVKWGDLPASSGWELITSTTFSGQTVVAFNGVLDATNYSQIQVYMNIKPDTDPMTGRPKLQLGNGGTYETGATDYTTTLTYSSTGQTFDSDGIELGFASGAYDAGGAAGEQFRSVIDVFKGWESTSQYTAIKYHTNYDWEGNDPGSVVGGGRRNNATAAHTDLRIIGASAFSGFISIRGFRDA